jgi:hypothetical protein
MSAERDVNRIVRSWIRTDEHESADRVLQTVLSRLDTTPQRRSWWPSRRIAHVNRFIVPVGAAAAALVVAIVGYSLLAGPGGPGAPTSPPATVTPTPTPRAFPTSGALEPGRYVWTVNGIRVVFEVPAGWSSDGTGIGKNIEQPSGIGFGPEKYLAQVTADACKGEETLRQIGPSAAELVAALDAQLGTTATVTDVDLGGLAAKRVDLAAEVGLDRSQCSEGSAGPLKISMDAAESGYFALAPGYTGFVLVADVGGKRLELRGVGSPGTPASDLAELEAIIASITIGT